jgi:hypothetical protein
MAPTPPPDDPIPSSSGCADQPMFDRKRDQVSGTSCNNPSSNQLPGATPDDADTAMAYDNPIVGGTSSFGFTLTPDVNLGGTNPYTFEFWIQPHADYGVGPIIAADGALTVNSYNYWGTNGLGITRGSTFHDGYLCANRDQWAHVAITYDGTTVKAYCNGTVVNSVADATSVPNPSSIKLFSANAAFDEVAVYDRALTAAEVAAHIDARNRHAGPPVNKTPPTISGAKTVGSTLTAAPGTWDGTLPMTYEYRWYRCAADATNYLACSTINLAWSSSDSYTTTNSDLHRRILVEVRATNSAGSATRYAALPYGPIAPVCGTYCATVSATSGLKDYWSMDDPIPSSSGCADQPMFDRKRDQVSGTSCNNPSSNQLPGATSDGTSLAMAYDNPIVGGTSFFGFTTSPNLDLSGTNPYTFEFWIQPHADYGVGPIIPAGGALTLTSNNYWGANGFGLQRGSTFHDGYLCAARDQWAHVAVTYDGATVKGYCNGLLTNSLTDSTSVTAPSSMRFFGSNAAYDELAIYDRALTQNEVQAHYAAR